MSWVAILSCWHCRISRSTSTFSRFSSCINGEITCKWALHAVASYAIDGDTGRLAYRAKHSSQGAWPCHLIVDGQGRRVLTANYLNGSLGVVPFDAEGHWLPGASRIQHQGSSVNPERQEGPHAHSINLDPDGEFAVAADLGIDQAKVYRYDAETGALAEHSRITVAPGSGPRHFAFHPNRRWAYLLNEIAATITACAWSPSAGQLEPFQTIRTLPDDWDGHVSTADIHVHPSGRWAYNSNRGHDSITMFAIDPTTGELSPVGPRVDPRPDAAQFRAGSGGRPSVRGQSGFRYDCGLRH